MRKYSEELKKQVVAEYIAGEKTTAEILSPHNIPKSNLYRWKKKYAPEGCLNPEDEFNKRNFCLQKQKIQRLEAINSILKQDDCNESMIRLGVHKLFGLTTHLNAQQDAVWRRWKMVPNLKIVNRSHNILKPFWQKIPLGLKKGSIFGRIKKAQNR